MVRCAFTTCQNLQNASHKPNVAPSESLLACSNLKSLSKRRTLPRLKIFIDGVQIGGIRSTLCGLAAVYVHRAHHHQQQLKQQHCHNHYHHHYHQPHHHQLHLHHHHHHPPLLLLLFFFFFFFILFFFLFLICLLIQHCSYQHCHGHIPSINPSKVIKLIEMACSTTLHAYSDGLGRAGPSKNSRSFWHVWSSNPDLCYVKHVQTLWSKASVLRMQ